MRMTTKPPAPSTPPTHPTTTGEPPPLIAFPCAFPIKVMGLNQPDFVDIMVAVVRLHDPEFDQTTLVMRESSGGKYQGLTITVTATSQNHLDDIYRALTGHPLSKYVL
jgi:putative lipoic acid-binding regulatory protein